MTDIEREIRQTLERLDQAVKTSAAQRSKPDLLPLFGRLDELTRLLPPGTSPDLLHYLHKKSYEKARLWLEGRDAENAQGKCPG